MASSYYVHTRTESAGLTFSYRCEQCGQESGPRKVTITGEAQEKNHRKQLNDAEEDRVRERAHADLVAKMKEIHSNITEKKIVPTEFPDECPHCHKPQSWAVAGLKKKMFENPIVCVGVGIFFSLIGLVAHYFGDMEYISIPVVIGFFAAGVVAGLVCLLWNIMKINAKVKKTSSGMQGGFPVFDWESVQYLLDEN